MQSRKQILADWEERLMQSGVDSPRLSAQVLLAHVLGLSRLDMLLDAQSLVDEAAQARMDTLCRRRMRGEPVAYLVGVKEFYGMSFQVGPAVLIPRPETELFLDLARERFKDDAAITVLDLGTGSGALAVSCARLFPFSRIVALDVSHGAIQIARRNAAEHNVLGQTAFVRGDMASALRLSSFDVVLANLPYVPESTRPSLSREVLEYEPELALFAGQDGLDCYRALARQMSGKMKPGAVLMCEIHCTQGAAMVSLFSPVAQSVRIVQDLAELDRVVVVVF